MSLKVLVLARRQCVILVQACTAGAEDNIIMLVVLRSLLVQQYYQTHRRKDTLSDRTLVPKWRVCHVCWYHGI